MTSEKAEREFHRGPQITFQMELTPEQYAALQEWSASVPTLYFLDICVVNATKLSDAAIEKDARKEKCIAHLRGLDRHQHSFSYLCALIEKVSDSRGATSDVDLEKQVLGDVAALRMFFKNARVHEPDEFLISYLRELRGAVLSIPVISTFETTLEVVAKFGKAAVLVTRANHMNAWIKALIRRYGYQHLVLDQATLDFPMSLPMLDRAYVGSEQFVNQFRQQARSLIRAGADVIVPAEGVLNTVLVENGVTDIDGVPVIDSYGILMAYGEMLVRLRSKQGSSLVGEEVPTRVAAQLRSATAVSLVRP